MIAPAKAMKDSMGPVCRSVQRPSSPKSFIRQFVRFPAEGGLGDAAVGR
jgi:hypothetical protein